MLLHFEVRLNCGLKFKLRVSWNKVSFSGWLGWKISIIVAKIWHPETEVVLVNCFTGKRYHLLHGVARWSCFASPRHVVSRDEWQSERENANTANGTPIGWRWHHGDVPRPIDARGILCANPSLILPYEWTCTTKAATLRLSSVCYNVWWSYLAGVTLPQCVWYFIYDTFSSITIFLGKNFKNCTSPNFARFCFRWVLNV